jgi:starch phosphorylase
MGGMRVRPIKTFTVSPALPDELQALSRLSRNLAWSWNTDASSLFERIDPEAWAATSHNALAVLQMCPEARLQALAHDPDFLDHLHRVAADFDAYLAQPPRIDVPGTGGNEVIAYFSLEFALTESLPNYSGGLGVLAGDHLKSSSDLGLPLVAVGLLYHQGYFTQRLALDGWQHEEYHQIDIAAQPLTRARDARGAPVFISVPLGDAHMRAALWRLDVGKASLILLDTALEENGELGREICGRLYGGEAQLRLRQEIVLGIGGVRALYALGMQPVVCHMNEGHSALLALERIRTLMETTGATFDEARLPVSAATVFTTHTAVAAGIDLFPPELVEQELGSYYAAMGLDAHSFIGLGRMDPHNVHEPFSMALLGLRLSATSNGVSRIHGGVSRRLWADAWPDLPEEDVPIGSITNGVHLPTWVNHEIGQLYDRAMGPGWRDNPDHAETWQHVYDIDDRELWWVHQEQRRRLIRHARDQYEASAARNGLATSDIAGLRVLDPEILTIGFARRFAGYKRATLLFRDVERLGRIVNHAERPVQFIFAGKAHPRDDGAKQMIREVQQTSLLTELRGRIVLLDHYDVALARLLVQGCDVWLNTPLRPLEASGTSGMKAVANGALHASVMDGWWSEAYRPGAGWAIGRDRPDDSPEVQDVFDAASLYDLLEAHIAPAFYTRDAEGVPRDWIGKMKRSIATYAPVYNTGRMVREYASSAYAPAAHGWDSLTRDNLRPARELAEWLARVRAAWPQVHVASVDDDARDEWQAGEPITVRACVQPGALTADDLCVEAVHGHAQLDTGLETDVVTRLELLPSREGVLVYGGEVRPGGGGRMGYTVRVVAHHPGLQNPLALGLVRWTA